MKKKWFALILCLVLVVLPGCKDPGSSKPSAEVLRLAIEEARAELKGMKTYGGHDFIFPDDRSDFLEEQVIDYLDNKFIVYFVIEVRYTETWIEEQGWLVGLKLGDEAFMKFVKETEVPPRPLDIRNYKMYLGWPAELLDKD